MSRRKGVFVVQLGAQAGARSTKTVKFDEPNTKSVFQAASANRSAEEIRER